MLITAPKQRPGIASASHSDGPARVIPGERPVTAMNRPRLRVVADDRAAARASQLALLNAVDGMHMVAAARSGDPGPVATPAARPMTPNRGHPDVSGAWVVGRVPLPDRRPGPPESDLPPGGEGTADG